MITETITVRIRVKPKTCQYGKTRLNPGCGMKLRRTKRKSWRKGFTECPLGHKHWYGRGKIIEREKVITA